MKKTYLVFLTIAIALSSCKSSQRADLGDGVFANIQTNQGDIVLKLEHEKTPVTVANFISLAEGKSPFVSDDYKDKPYYDGLTFHRVMKDFMIQGGDPMASGQGGPGYKFMDEFNDSLVHDKKGILSMANPGPDANGSQFFITHKETPWLNNRHSVFGEVVEGLDVLDSIANVPVGPGNKPIENVVMNKVEIIRNGKEAKNFDAVAVMSAYFENEGERLAALEKEKAEKLVEVNKLKAEFASEIISQREKATSLPSGLQIVTLTKGSNEKPKTGQNILVNYAGYLADGTLFDTNYTNVADNYGRLEEISQRHGGDMSPLKISYSPDMPMIAGFKEGLLNMNIGEKVRVFIPPHLGYGEQGSGPIPPNADLVFDMEIVGIAQ